MKECLVSFLGRVDYARALDFQLRICAAKRSGFEADVLLLLEHPPTITLGRNGKWYNLLVPEEVLQQRGVTRFEVDRGGDITFHGPGQLVGYPLLKLETGERDVHLLMWRLEESLIRSLSQYGITAGRIESLTGVWAGEEKIAAMGIHISRWITRHGFALNVSTDTSYFDLIVPCGLTGKGITSMEKLLRRQVAIDEVARCYVKHFGEVFGRRVLEIPEEDLFIVVPGGDGLPGTG